jgi:hypothetical protein
LRFVREEKGALLPAKNRRADEIFQRFDLLADSAGGDVEFVRSPSKT